jgi:single-strand DNA-binding protein
MKNLCIFIGNVGDTPKVSLLPNAGNNNNKVANISLATSEKYRDKNNELVEKTEWIPIVAFGANANLAEKYIKKGTQLYVEGKFRTRSWTDDAGAKHYTTEIVADDIKLLGKKPAVDDMPES